MLSLLIECRIVCNMMASFVLVFLEAKLLSFLLTYNLEKVGFGHLPAISTRGTGDVKRAIAYRVDSFKSEKS